MAPPACALQPGVVLLIDSFLPSPHCPPAIHASPMSRGHAALAAVSTDGAEYARDKDVLAEAQQQVQRRRRRPQESRDVHVIDMGDVFLHKRADEIRSVQRQVGALSSAFMQIATMIRMHGELTSHIDRNIRDASRDIEAGQDELTDYMVRVEGGRGLAFKILLVLVIFIIFIVLWRL